jgi:hypothetical protein
LRAHDVDLIASGEAGNQYRGIVAGRATPNVAMPFLSMGAWHVQSGLDGACLTEGRLTLFGSIGIRNGRLVFFPWRLHRHSSRNKKASAHGRPPLRFGLFRCGPIAPGLIDSHRGRDGRGPSN